MDQYSNKDVEWLLNLHNKGDIRTPHTEAATRSTRSRWKRYVIRFLIGVAGLLTLVILPFFLLVRTSVYLNLTQGLSSWPSLIGGILAAILLLLVYLLILSYKVKNKRLVLKLGAIGISTVVLGFSLFSLFYLSSVNSKSDEVRDVYRSLHPILRVAVSTVTLADNDLVVTDIERFEEDYASMGLPVNQSSLHFRQETGYVHAIDIRTIGRGTVRNALLRGSLELMGFRTIRHVGTADHLHVELENR